MVIIEITYNNNNNEITGGLLKSDGFLPMKAQMLFNILKFNLRLQKSSFHILFTKIKIVPKESLYENKTTYKVQEK